MADVQYNFRRMHVPLVDKVMDAVEGTCRTYDRSIVRVIWIVVALVTWMVVADSLVGTTSVEYVGSWKLGKTFPVEHAQDRAKERVLYRVMRTMSEQCTAGEDDVILAPQVHVNGEPYMYRIVRICRSAIELVNPVVAVRGTDSGQCIDEHDGQTRRSSRYYPITVHSANAPPATFLQLSEVCTFMHALSLLDVKW